MQQHAATPHARAGETFLLSECYASIQGESSFVGTPTIFVRLYTCNLRCAWCDSMHAVEGGDYREVTVADLATEMRSLAEAHGPLDGLLHIAQVMDDRVDVDEENQRLIGKDTKRDLRIGDRVRVRIVAVSLNERAPRESKIGLTMRQPALGKHEGIGGDRSKGGGRGEGGE